MRRLTDYVHRRLPSLPPADWERPAPDKAGLRRDMFAALGLLAFAIVMQQLSLSLTEVEHAPSQWASLAVLSAMILPLMFRRRWPISMMLLGSAAFMVSGTSEAYMVTMQICAQLAYFLGLYTAVTWSRNRRALWSILSIVLLAMAVWIIIDLFTSDLMKSMDVSMVDNPAGDIPADIAFPLYTFLINLLFFGGSIFLGLVSWSNAYANELVKTQAQRIADQSQQLADRAVNEERLRIARELHDVIAHHIASVGVQAGAARMVQRRDPEKAAELMKGIEDSARSAVGETRALLGVLRESGGDMLPDSGGDARRPEPSMKQLPTLLAENRAQGLAVELSRAEHTPGYLDSLPAGVSLALYRICGEALANVRRHSTARRATLSLRSGVDEQGPWVEAEITDEGTTLPDSSGSGFGLRGIRERANLHHGLVEIGPRVPHGWRTRARLRVVAGAETTLVP
ncbi:signal transduction histidine kinase [Arthrobacter sp. AG1021]|uniref:sensor histidine kinase n=1 Tax=Arthrobacter sp. AG1021 TaxID=2183908 RepID=UPI000EB16B21|nr:histidine kinase [Arthrobacter sp. AG1021]RKS15996.1 signal transduction histidine kinase [Arthrobacter sp. AG1021]